MIFLYLSGGVFLGWSLGANDAANIFGTAVGTRMVKFRTAALFSSLFVILGAVLEGSGASQTLAGLGAISSLAPAFVVSSSAAITVTAMTRLGVPVSTSQAIIGAIIGWNIYSGSQTDLNILSNIVLSWVLSPVLAALFALCLYFPVKYLVENSRIHLLTLDAYTRFGLILAGALGAYSLGANNIANVIGVFTTANPFKEIDLLNISISPDTQLLFSGGLAIAAGIISYSHKVMKTIGNDLFRLSPITALIVVVSHSLVLYLFASERLREMLITLNIPPLPLVPVSSSQAIIGAIVGIALAKKSRNIKFGMLGKIASGWITTPLIAALISFTVFFSLKL